MPAGRFADLGLDAFLPTFCVPTDPALTAWSSFMIYSKWKGLAKWTLWQDRDRHAVARTRFAPRVDRLEERELLSHVIHHPAAPSASSITQTTGGAGGQNSGGGAGVAVIAPINGSFLNGAQLTSPLPVVHVFNAHGRVIGVRPVLSPFSLNVNQRTGGPGGTGGGGGAGIAVLVVPTIPTTLPKFGLAHGKLYRIFPPLTQQGFSITQTTGGAGGPGGGGGGGFAVLIPVATTIPTTTYGKVGSVVPVYLVSSPIPTVAEPTINQQTGGPGGAGGGGGAGISFLL